MLTFEQFFNPSTLNVFTDASMNSYGTIACPGALCVFGEVDKKLPMLRTEFTCMIHKNVTNNIGEALAVQMGLFMALKYRNFPIIRIISDSQVTIFGIRDRILNWRESKKKPGVLIGSNDTIKNQEYFLEMLYTILEANIPIQFLHQQGHTSFTEKGLETAMHVFKVSNGIRDDVDPDIIRAISQYNNFVDRTTRQKLNTEDLSLYNFKDPFRYHYKPFDKERYYALTHTFQGGLNNG